MNDADDIEVVLRGGGPLFPGEVVRRVGLRRVQNMPPRPFDPDAVGGELWRLVDRGELTWRHDRRVALPEGVTT